MENPSVSIISTVQAPIQSFLRPAVWIPGIRSPHSHGEKWTFPTDNTRVNLEEVLKALVIVIKKDKKSRSFWDVQPIRTAFLRVFVYTKAEWLDIIEIKFKGNTAEVWAFSSGFLPLCIPFACVLNLPFFWIPFLDMGLNKHRINKIVAAMEIPVERH